MTLTAHTLFDAAQFKHPQILQLKPRIGLSQCLIGDNVRYNAKSKRQPIISDYLSRFAEIIPICPEVGAGLSTPRPAVQLMEIEQIKMLGVDNNNLDVTDAVQQYSDNIAHQYKGVFHAFIFKARSPSCGYNSAALYDHDAELIGITSGIFAHTVTQQWPDCLFYQEEDLCTEEQCHTLLLACYQAMDKQWPAI